MPKITQMQESSLMDSAQIKPRSLNTGLIVYSIRENTTETNVLLKSIISNGNSVFLLINRKRFGDMEVAGWMQISDDLLEQAPDEIRVTDSLFVGQVDQDFLTNPTMFHLLGSGAAMVLVSKLDGPALLEARKLLWVWFSRPSILQHQFENGSKSLAKKLIEGIQYVLLHNAKTSEFQLVASE